MAGMFLLGEKIFIILDIKECHALWWNSWKSYVSAVLEIVLGREQQNVICPEVGGVAMSWGRG